MLQLLDFFVANQIFALSVIEQVNNATARVMTNKKLVSPYANGEGLSTLPYGKKSFRLPHCLLFFPSVAGMPSFSVLIRV